MLLQELFETKSESHRDAAIAALHRRLTSKGDKESVISAAYEVGRSFGIPARELERMYKDSLDEAKTKPGHNMMVKARTLDKLKKALPKQDTTKKEKD